MRTMIRNVTNGLLVRILLLLVVSFIVAFLMSFAAGCQPLMQTAQGAVDGVAARYGAEGLVAEGREALAEAEAAKVGRVLLPRGTSAMPVQHRDSAGTALTNGVIELQYWVLRRQLASAPAPAPFVIPPPAPEPTPIQVGSNQVDPEVQADIDAENAKRNTSND